MLRPLLARIVYSAVQPSACAGNNEKKDVTLESGSSYPDLPDLCKRESAPGAAG